MHGLIFMTWEKYLLERFQGSMMMTYRAAIGETVSTAPLASRVYDDDLLLTGVNIASDITKLPVEQLLYEYGRYFIMNGLTRHLCAYLLTQVNNGRDLLLAMYAAHKQMGRLPEGLTPPLFRYQAFPNAPNDLVLYYDSPRKLCPLLFGAIEGAAESFGEQVAVVERTCMKQGASVCRFDLRFSTPTGRLESPVQREQLLAQQQFTQMVLSLLPDRDGITLAELQKLLEKRGAHKNWLRPARLLEALRHLHHAGLVANTANQPGDVLTTRRYWRAPTSG
ncbi:MAG TPA: heme NO-binding domain-containing protein [Ktedonosporobacter sp.]|jgi:hypothetical protein|nr:heme NO-binding domain-containing protein [Ktedonosporobacter sp.]